MKGKDSLVYKLVLDISKAMKDMDRFRNKAVRVNRDISDAGTAMERGWRSPRSFGLAGMTHLSGSPMGRRTPGSAIPGGAATEEAVKKMSLLGRISDKLGTTFGLASIKAATLGGSFNTLATHLLKLNPLIVGSILAFGKMMERTFHYGNIIEQSKMVLTSIWDSEKRAVKAIAGMREFSRITQHSPEEVVGGTTMLAKYGVDPFEKGAFGLAKDKNVMNLMSGLAAMPGMGGLPIGLDRAINAAIAGRDVRPLKALGPEVLAAYEKARGAGISGSSEYIEVMLTELAKIPKIMNLAVAQADTLSTLWSTITGYAEEFFMDFSGAGEEQGIVTLWSQVRDILRVIRDQGEFFVIYIGPYLTELGAALGSAFTFIFETIRLIWSFIGPVLTPAFKIFVQLARIVLEVFKGVLTTVIQLGKLFYEIVSFPVRILNLILGIDIKLSSIVDKLMKVVLGLQISFMFLKIFIDGIIETVRDSVDYMIRELTKFMDKFSWFFNAIGESMKQIPGIGAFLQARDLSKQLQNVVPEQYKVGGGGAAAINFGDKELSEMTEGERMSYAASNPMGAFWKLMKHNAEQERQYRKGGGQPSVGPNITIINNETTKPDIQKVKDMSGAININPWKRK